MTDALLKQSLECDIVSGISLRNNELPGTKVLANHRKARKVTFRVVVFSFEESSDAQYTCKIVGL